MQELLTFTCAYKGCTHFVPVTEILCKEHDKQVIDEIYSHQPVLTLSNKTEQSHAF